MGSRNLIEDHLSLPIDPVARKMIEDGITVVDEATGVDNDVIDALLSNIENNPRVIIHVPPREAMSRFWIPGGKSDKGES